jgi:hypothetical protein
MNTATESRPSAGMAHQDGCAFRLSEATVRLPLPAAVASELHDRATAHVSAPDEDRAVTDLLPSPGLIDELFLISSCLDAKRPLVILSPPIERPPADHVEVYAWLIAKALGEPLVQDADGRRLVRVFDRRLGTMVSGARYHRTREGGDIHTDNVNDPTTFEFVALACGAPSKIGGESIFVRASDVFEILMANCPDVVATLRSDYLFERRGMSESSNFYRHPILQVDEARRPHFRYLRTYIESAHHKAQQPLTKEQTYAIDVLDALLAKSEIQLRIELSAGDVAIFRDTLVLHGRTPFVDDPNTRRFKNDTIAARDAWAPGQRVYFRAWVKQSDALIAS